MTTLRCERRRFFVQVGPNYKLQLVSEYANSMSLSDSDTSTLLVLVSQTLKTNQYLLLHCIYRMRFYYFSCMRVCHRLPCHWSTNVIASKQVILLELLLELELELKIELWYKLEVYVDAPSNPTQEDEYSALFAAILKTQPFPTNLTQLRAVETQLDDASKLRHCHWNDIERSARVGYTWWTDGRIWSVCLNLKRAVWSEVGKPREQASDAMVMQKKVTEMLMCLCACKWPRQWDE